MTLHGLLGRKLGMTTIFTERGEAVPVTVVEAGPNMVTQVRTKARDGYDAVQLGFGDVEQRKLTKPVQGQQKALGGKFVKYLREMPADDVSAHTPGEIVDVDLFNANDLVDVTGKSKGKGFQGVMRRHNFHGGPRTHGQSDRMRAPGSIGSGTSPGRVWKGMRMAGRMGGDRKTVQRLQVVRVDTERHLLLIKGSVPGAKNGLLYVRRTVKPTK
ncbi:MAG: 50S ribosomal protein L3 [Herpetosiphonaceae bacterium]|nr:50S ribosomal protein L3 [Herpetosiphonaceae bacterium]